MPRRVASYSWDALERLDRAAVRAVSGVRRMLEDPTLEALARGVGDIVGADAKLVVRRTRGADRRPRGLLLPLDVVGGRARLTLGLEPALASRLLAPLLGRTVTVDRLEPTADPTLLGALAAIAIEAVRRAGGLAALAPAWQGAAAIEARVAALVEASLLLDGRGYAVDMLVELEASLLVVGAVRLAALGALPIALVLVTGMSSASAADLAALEPGAAWMPGRGFWIDRAGVGRAALTSPLSDRGVRVDLAPDGQIVLRGELVELPVEVEPADNPMTNDVTTEQPLEQALLEAPLVVRIEMGAVTLSAREWAELRPGDVIETGRRVGEPVVLRVSGREVARGELVEIEGELGVRIRELVREENA